MPATYVKPSAVGLTVRSKPILLFYLFAALLAFVRSSLGPCMPFLRQELGFSYTIAAYHFSAISIGVIVAGCIGDRILPRLGRQRAVWLGLTGVFTGVSLILSCHFVVGTIAGMLMIGLFSSFIGQSCDSTFTEHLPTQRTVAIAEANIVASTSCMVAPLAVGAFVSGGASWRVPLLVALGGFAIAWYRCRAVMIPPAVQREAHESTGKLSAAYWAYWSVILLACAAEWSIIFWSTEFLIHAGNMAQGAACTAVSAFFVSMLLGRVFGSRIATKYNTTKLLPLFAFTALTGFLMFWVFRPVSLMVSGLFLCGLGISCLYPFTLSAALGLNPRIAPRATSRMGIAGGASGLFGPLLLGCLADTHGIVVAYGAVAALLSIMLGVIFAAKKIAGNQPQP
jgi:fucose permease